MTTPVNPDDFDRENSVPSFEEGDLGGSTVRVDQVVRVSGFGMDTVEVPYVEDKDVQYYLAVAKLLPGRLSRNKKVYTLNGETVGLNTTVPVGGVIVVANKVRNG